MPQNNCTYYTNQMSKMMKGFERMFRSAQMPICRFVDDSKLVTIHVDARTVFETLVPQLPYIGGKKNPGTSNLIGTTQLLAIIRALEKQGLAHRQIGEIIYRTMEHYMTRMPRFAGKLMGITMASKWYINKRRKMAEETQRRKYPETFVNEFVPPVRGSFDYGHDTVECAVLKFFRKQGAEAYMPYICLGDYPMFHHMGLGLVRTKALGHGDNCCDFRVQVKGTTPSGWPPENLAEWKGHPLDMDIGQQETR